MKHEEVFFRHILDEINFLIAQTVNITFDEFARDEVLKRASARSLEIIGEAAKNISVDFKEKYNDIEWKKLTGLRDKIIHYYFGVNWDIVWDVMKNILPNLKIKIERALNDFGFEK